MAKDTVKKEETSTAAANGALPGGPAPESAVVEFPRPTHVPCDLCGRPSGQTHKRNSQRFFKCEGFADQPGCGWTFKVDSERYHEHCHAVETGKWTWRRQKDGRFFLDKTGE